MNYSELFKVDGLPVFQNKMFTDSQAARDCPKGNMNLVQDMKTGLIFNAAFDSALLQYDADYQNEQACSSVFQQHLKDVKKIIERQFHSNTLIEVGCGKGYFLEYLQRAGYDITGIDPAYEGNNSKVIKANFDASLGLSAEGIVLRHVLEHILDPVSFLSNISNANSGKGKIYIEVPCFDWICEHHAWFDIFYEHVNYFRLSDFHRIFGKVYESGHIFGGQYLYVVAELSSLQQPVLEPVDVIQFPLDFFSDIDRVASNVHNKRNAIWGGASKGVIFALYMQRAGVNIDLVIDINPAKQNKYLAASGLKVISPDNAMKILNEKQNIIIMNSNYLQEIIDQSHNKFNYIQVEHHEL